jgi:hypothetical protein
LTFEGVLYCMIALETIYGMYILMR